MNILIVFIIAVVVLLGLASLVAVGALASDFVIMQFPIRRSRSGKGVRFIIYTLLALIVLGMIIELRLRTA